MALAQGSSHVVVGGAKAAPAGRSIAITIRVRQSQIHKQLGQRAFSNYLEPLHVTIMNDGGAAKCSGKPLECSKTS